MTRDERNTKLKHFITCLKCEVGGRECDDNCPVQYEAGSMGEIIENLEAISKVLEQQTCENAVSRQAVIDAMYVLCDTGESLNENPWRDNPHIDALVETIEQIPPVTPQHTEAEIQKMQELEQAEIQRAYELGKAEQQTCEDAISRQAVIDIFADNADATRPYSKTWEKIRDLPPVNPQPKMGHCKDCKYFEYDSLAKVDGIPLIVAHEIYSKWGDGCKTKEDGYCFLFEPQESEVKE